MPGNANSGGRNKKSASAHILRGTFRGHRHGGDTTPEPPKTTSLAPPKPLSGEARSEWDRMVASLVINNTLTTVDHHSLYQYVELFAETESIKADNIRLRSISKKLMAAAGTLEGAELVEAMSRIVELENALSKKVIQLRQGHMGLRQWLVEFGMTPSARTRVKQVGSGRTMSRAEQFMASKGGQ